MPLKDWYLTRQKYPTDMMFSIPQINHADLVEIQNEIGGFCIDTLMRYILEEGWQMDDLEFVTGVVDETLSVALESYCTALGVDDDNLDNHILGPTVVSVALSNVTAVAEIALDIREQLLNFGVPVISDMGICAYKFVGSSGAAVHLQQVPTEDFTSIARFRENTEICQMLSTLTKSLKSPILY